MQYNNILAEAELTKNFLIETDDTDELVILSKINVAKVEAMIKTDSSYSNVADENIEGSSAYCFKQLKKILENVDNNSLLKDYYNIIFQAVCTVDKENSTHLNADKVGRKEIADRIAELKIKDLIYYLKNPDETDFKLFNLIAKKTTYKEGKHHRCNPSFASKFCHYACFYMFAGLKEQDNYSIYDSIVRDVLPLYAQKYNVECNKSKLKNYSTYRKVIDEIIKKSNSNISRNGFDHLLWYYHKGRN